MHTAHGHLEITSRGISLIHGKVEDGVVDRVDDLAVNAALHGIPVGIIGLGSKDAINVRAKTKFAAQRFEEECPL
jgi:hypothetical protein